MRFDGCVVPEALRPYVDWVTAMAWPEVNPRRCFRLADACVVAAHRVVADTDAADLVTANLVGERWDGAAQRLFVAHVRDKVGGRRADLVKRLINAALALNGVGVTIQHAQRMITLIVILMMTVVPFLIWRAPWALSAFLRVSRMSALQIAMLASKLAVLFASIGGALELVTELSQVKGGRRDEIDTHQVLITVRDGAISGLLTGLLQGGLGRLATPALRDGIARAEAAFGEKLMALLTGTVPGQALQYGVAGSAAAAISTVLDGRPLDWDLILKSGTSAALGADGQHLATPHLAARHSDGAAVRGSTVGPESPPTAHHTDLAQATTQTHPHASPDSRIGTPGSPVREPRTATPDNAIGDLLARGGGPHPMGPDARRAPSTDRAVASPDPKAAPGHNRIEAALLGRKGAVHDEQGGPGPGRQDSHAAGPPLADSRRPSTEPVQVADLTVDPKDTGHDVQGIVPDTAPDQPADAPVTHTAEISHPQAGQPFPDHPRTPTSEWVQAMMDVHGAEARSPLAYMNQRAQAISEVSAELSLSHPKALNALEVAYDAARANHAPTIVRSVEKMIPDLVADAAAGHTLLHLGRDGEAMARVTEKLTRVLVDPAFFERHCTVALVSRKMAEAAVQDLERGGRSFPELKGLRHMAHDVDPSDVPGAAQLLTDYLRSCGVPVGRESAITIVDNGFRGTIQEMLSAMYGPETSFTGRYMFFAQSPGDPHPGTKQGYEFHLGLDRSNGGSPLFDPLPPREVGLTFQSNWALYAIEETMQGPRSSPARIGDDGHPVQALERDNRSPTHGLNPVLIPEALTDPAVREAVLRINLIAIDHCVDHVMELRSKGDDWQGELDRGRDRMLSNVRAWIARGQPDPEFAFMTNAFARREFGAPIFELASAIEGAGISREEERRVWESFERLTREEKAPFVEAFKRSHAQGAGEGG
ncbi:MULTISPECIES: hypothetical protein [unclassified Nonomuraea]|uniref:hypothetical protein n=1 Tax=unclassified Nonomuraea TaxID=2593643 RepID=UPI00340C0EBC